MKKVFAESSAADKADENEKITTVIGAALHSLFM